MGSARNDNDPTISGRTSITKTVLIRKDIKPDPDKHGIQFALGEGITLREGDIVENTFIYDSEGNVTLDIKAINYGKKKLP